MPLAMLLLGLPQPPLLLLSRVLVALRGPWPAAAAAPVTDEKLLGRPQFWVLLRTKEACEEDWAPLLRIPGGRQQQ